ncbi:MAG: acetyl-CoA decarbonylase/synthase complex subunit delta [Firmicutes bacterium]|nr:acetyl-CoA decarbonylase/synthase complex subunit delta [Bacillota bacterium]
MSALKINAKLRIEKVIIGATEADGGTRSGSVAIGGQSAMPFLGKDGDLPFHPVIAMEFQDEKPAEANSALSQAMGEHWDDPVKWAKFLTDTTGCPLLMLRLMGMHPDYGSKTPEETIGVFRKILGEVKTPLIVMGCGIQELDDILIPAAAEAGAGEKLLLGRAVAEKYREITDACIKHGHSLITESPIDINIAKQANILVQDAGLPSDRIVMYATTGALGYGLEYAYSIMEKTRLSGLQGDNYMNKPQIALAGQESWRAKEAMTSTEAGINWEVMTATAYIHAGADIVVLKHPDSAAKTMNLIKKIL